MATLKTNYKDDVLDTSKNTKRKYNMINNPDGTVSLEDVTSYTQIGDKFGAGDINGTNTEINALNTSLNQKLPQDISGFSVGEDGSPYITYKVGADSVTKKLGSSIGDEEVIYDNGNNIKKLFSTGATTGTVTFGSKYITMSCSTTTEQSCEISTPVITNANNLYEAVFVEYSSNKDTKHRYGLVNLYPQTTDKDMAYAISYSGSGTQYYGCKVSAWNGTDSSGVVNGYCNSGSFMSFYNWNSIEIVPNILYIHKISLIKR